jgi:hypothetical protein
MMLVTALIMACLIEPRRPDVKIFSVVPASEPASASRDPYTVA